MIRLGSLAGYSFEGPRVLAGWTPPAVPAVYAIGCKPEPETRPDRFAIIYVDHGADLSAEGFPFRHRKAAEWIKRAGNKYALFICTFEIPGGSAAHREQIVAELCSVYRPSCNDQQYESSWRGEWIGDYEAPTTGPLTTDRTLDD